MVIQSQAILEEAVFIGPWGPLSAFVRTHVPLQKKHPKVKTNYQWFSVKCDLTAEAGGQGRKILKTKLIRGVV